MARVKGIGGGGWGTYIDPEEIGEVQGKVDWGDLGKIEGKEMGEVVREDLGGLGREMVESREG